MAVVGLTFAIPAVVAMPQRKFSDAVTILSSNHINRHGICKLNILRRYSDCYFVYRQHHTWPQSLEEMRLLVTERDLPKFMVDRTCHIHRSPPSINHHTAPSNTFIPGRHRNRLLHPIQQHPRPRQLVHTLRWLYSLLHRHHRRLLRRRAHNRLYRFRDTRPHGSFGKHAVEIPRRTDGFDLVASCHDERVYICHVEVPYF